MASGIKRLRKIQLGQEVTAGTSVAATTVWGGLGVLKDTREIVAVDEDIGFLIPSTRNYIPNAGALITFESTPCTFEQIGYFLAGGIEDVTTGVADGSGSGKVYTHDVSTNAGQTPQSFTIEMGDNVRQDEADYCYCESFSLSGASNEAVMMSGVFRGRQAVDGSFTSSQTVPTVEEVLFNKGALYIDATGGTVGSTSVANTLLGFSLEVDTGHRPLYCADGTLYFGSIKQTGVDITGTLLMEHNASSEAQLAIARAGTQQLLRLKFVGAALTTAGTAYTYKTLQIDLAYEYTDVPELGDQDGDDILEFPFRMVYNATDSLGGQFVVVNQSATLT